MSDIAGDLAGFPIGGEAGRSAKMAGEGASEVPRLAGIDGAAGGPVLQFRQRRSSSRQSEGTFGTEKQALKDVQFMQARLAMADRKWEEAVKGLLEVRVMPQNAFRSIFARDSSTAFSTVRLTRESSTIPCWRSIPKSFGDRGKRLLPVPARKNAARRGNRGEVATRDRRRRFCGERQLAMSRLKLKRFSQASRPTGTEQHRPIRRQNAGQRRSWQRAVDYSASQFELKRGNVDAAKKLVSNAN